MKRIKIQVSEELTYVHNVVVEVKDNEEIEKIKKIVEEAGHFDDFIYLLKENGVKVVEKDESDDYRFIGLDVYDIYELDE